jgi:ubiquinone/menaquinone biosynthesis C-methylase UbiE
MPWFRKPAGDPLTVAMCGIKLGDRLLVLGCSDTALVAALAGKAGLTGRACMLCESETEKVRAGAAVEREGALVEGFAAPMTALPFEDDSFDVVVIRRMLARLEADARRQCVEDVRRVVRPGGRCIVIDNASRGGIAALVGGQRTDRQYAETKGAASLLSAAGFLGVRTLAEREALIFVEGVKAGRGDV